MRQGYLESSVAPKPFELLFALLLILTIIAFFQRQDRVRMVAAIPKDIAVVIGIIILSVCFSWALTLVTHRAPLESLMIMEFGRLLISLLIFFLIILYVNLDPTHWGKCFWAVLLPVIYVIFLATPGWAMFFHMAFPDGRFYGLTNNVNTLSKILLIPLVFFGAVAISPKNRTDQRIIFFVLASGLAALLFWAASRGGILAGTVGLIFAAILSAWEEASPKKAVRTLSIAIMIFVLGFILAPLSGKQVSISRVLMTDTKQTNYATFKDQSIKNIVSQSLEKNKDISLDSETRIQIWSFYGREVIRYPLGFGPAFYIHLQPYLKSFGHRVPSGSHNSYLEILLLGGWLGFFAFVLLLKKVWRSLSVAWSSPFQSYAIVLSSILISLSVAMFFDDSFKMYWFWIILALIISLGRRAQAINSE
jgi:O-antigen ligase